MTWLYVPETSSPSARVSEDLNSESCSPSLIGERLAEASATWRGKERQPLAWSRAWKRGGFIRLLSGLTCSPSTLDSGVASFISSLRETPAKTTALPESAPDRPESGSLLPRSAVSPKSAGLMLSSGRTCRGTRTDNSKPSSRHWSDWATALRQEYSARPRPEIACGASDCSSWPSARTSDPNVTGEHGDGGMDLRTAAANWHAPRANDPEKRGAIAADPRNGLAGQGENWEAPSVAVTDGSRKTRGGTRARELLLTGQPEAVMQESLTWPAPAARDHKGVNRSTPHPDYNARPLNEIASTWVAPMAADARGSAGVGKNELPNQASFFHPPSSPDLPTIAGGALSSTDGPNSNQPSVKRKLNPIFVEALMRWPTGLSGFERAETAWTRWWQLQLTFLSALVSQPSDRQGSLF